MNTWRATGAQPSLPLWPRVIFVDWHGVLSDQLFWHSILDNPRNSLQEALRAATQSLFRSEDAQMSGWMRGEITTDTVVATLEADLPLDRRHAAGFLKRRLREDCRRFAPDALLTDALAAARAQSFVVLATDNMECFREQVDKIGDLGRAVDHVLCSSELGTLKSDGVEDFFSPWLVAHDIPFASALLIDDSQETCLAFGARGGSAIIHKEVGETLSLMRAWLS